ncbi:protein disulfide-isomerase erp38 [Fusarium austroafricanum]|uniref:protein disulfide-isomerase n=1 Tax=Fusarium austroafricanum TaxID=2364996 RepID=A0A8H4K9V9_9HYPO|nr:protein disulfide-isomerase erp38 [Fusarium austroafricanum]
MVLIKSFVLGALAAAVAAKSAVIELLPTNFDEIVLKSGKPTLVEFFAPWCGHCKKLAPVWEDLANTYEHAKDKVQIAKVDADAQRELGKRFGIQGFPTLKFFDGKSNKPQEYKSGRDLESLTNFIVEKTGVKPKKKLELPSQVTYLNDATFTKAIGGDKHVLVAFTAPWCGHCKSLAPTWEDLANTFANEKNVLIAKVDAEAPNSKGVAEEQGVKSYPTIKWFPAGSKEAAAYESGRSEQAFVDWINEHAGTHRVAGGGLDTVAGTVESLDTLVTKITGGAAIAEVAEEVKKEVESLTDAAQKTYAEYYVRVFDKLSSNNDWVSKELTRLNGILSKGGLAPAKRDQIQQKTNVLRKFAQKAAEKAEEIKDEL